MPNITRWGGIDPFQEMEELMRRFPTAARNTELAHSFVPAMDVYETKKDVVIETPLAGIDPEQVEVSVEKGVLTISGETKREHEVDDKNYYRKEIRTGSFYRQVALPTAVKEDKVAAVFEDGILKITAPKAEPSQAKKVSVKIAKKK